MPLPIETKIAELHKRIVSREAADWTNHIVSGDIKNLFEGNKDTIVEISSGFGGTNGVNDRFITFDLGKPRILDRIVFTNAAGNASFEFDINLRLKESTNVLFEFKAHPGLIAELELDLKRDETMSMSQYLNSALSDRDVKEAS